VAMIKAELTMVISFSNKVMLQLQLVLKKTVDRCKLKWICWVCCWGMVRQKPTSFFYFTLLLLI